MPISQFFWPSLCAAKGGQVHPLASGVDRDGRCACDIHANALATMHAGNLSRVFTPSSSFP
ncbi:MAG: hypothetical protein JWQ54_1466 [Mucilaginibacter sp.]|nr:hypothetical protein [Mucilaginibacter sp.]